MLKYHKKVNNMKFYFSSSLSEPLLNFYSFLIIWYRLHYLKINKKLKKANTAVQFFYFSSVLIDNNVTSQDSKLSQKYKKI